jgi:hypothetical protein
MEWKWDLIVTFDRLSAESMSQLIKNIKEFALARGLLHMFPFRIPPFFLLWVKGYFPFRSWIHTVHKQVQGRPMVSTRPVVRAALQNHRATGCFVSSGKFFTRNVPVNSFQGIYPSYFIFSPQSRRPATAIRVAPALQCFPCRCQGDVVGSNLWLVSSRRVCVWVKLAANKKRKILLSRFQRKSGRRPIPHLQEVMSSSNLVQRPTKVTKEEGEGQEKQ